LDITYRSSLIAFSVQELWLYTPFYYFIKIKIIYVYKRNVNNKIIINNPHLVLEFNCKLRYV